MKKITLSILFILVLALAGPAAAQTGAGGSSVGFASSPAITRSSCSNGNTVSFD